jgi:hypothetical protein
LFVPGNGFEDGSEISAVVMIAKRDANRRGGGKGLKQCGELFVIVDLAFQPRGVATVNGKLGLCCDDFRNDPLKVFIRLEPAIRLSRISRNVRVGNQRDMEFFFRFGDGVGGAAGHGDGCRTDGNRFEKITAIGGGMKKLWHDI